MLAGVLVLPCRARCLPLLLPCLTLSLSCGCGEVRVLAGVLPLRLLRLLRVLRRLACVLLLGTSWRPSPRVLLP